MNPIIPGLSIDCVIFGFHDNRLKVLLMKLKNIELWALPGGFIRNDEDIDQEANRVLKSRTGISDEIFLRQFYTFGNKNRTPMGHAQMLLRNKIIEAEVVPFLDQRFVSVGYYALVEYSKIEAAKPDNTSEFCEWMDIEDLPPMMLDHNEIVEKAHSVLQKELDHQPIGLNLLPDYFTMPELQALYETILGKTLDRRNFRRKILGYGILKATDKKRNGVAHKAPILYQFEEESYQLAVENGFKSNW